MAKILDMDKKYQIILIILVLCFLIIVFGTISASILSKFKLGEEDVAYVINDGDIAINYIDGKIIDFNKKGNMEYGVTLTNTSKERIYYSINLDVYKSSKGLSVEVLDEDGVLLKENQVNKKFSGKILSLYYLNPDETVRHIVKFSMKKRVNFKGELNVINESLSSEIFADMLINNLSVGTAQSRVGSEVATLDEGLISTTDNKGNAYYFRGNVKNNYVKIGDYLFRIVRINGDSSIRLVLDSSIGNYVYNTNSLVEGQEFSSLGFLGNATLVNELNNWVNDKLGDYSAFIVNGDFCMESDYSYQLNDSSYSKVYERIFVDNAPMLECSNVYTGKVGLLSIDEVVYAGAYRNSINKSYYLYNPEIEEAYLTSSGYFYSNNKLTMINVNNNGSIGDGISIGEKAAIRPVINISSAAKVNGEGTLDDPFVIVD